MWQCLEIGRCWSHLFSVFSWYSNSNWANCYRLNNTWSILVFFFLFYLPNYIAVISLVLGACCIMLPWLSWIHQLAAVSQAGGLNSSGRCWPLWSGWLRSAMGTRWEEARCCSINVICWTTYKQQIKKWNVHCLMHPTHHSCIDEYLTLLKPTLSTKYDLTWTSDATIRSSQN